MGKWSTLWSTSPLQVFFKDLDEFKRTRSFFHSSLFIFNPSLKGNLLSRDISKLVKVTSNGRSYYVEKLKKGEIVGVAVGGVEEACFDFDYNTEWGSRTGFANVALEAGKDIKILY